MEFLSNSLNRFCKSSSLHLSSKLWISRRVTGKTRLIHTPSFLDNSEMHNKLKVLIARRHKGSVYYSKLFTGQNLLNDNDIYFPNTMRSYYFFPSASCNALLFAHYEDLRLSSALWNPATDELKSLPKSLVPRPPLAIPADLWAFGFGFDRASEDYKVVRIITLCYAYGIIQSDAFQVELYSLKSDSWKEIAYPPLPVTPMMGQPSIHINGFSYWVTSKFILWFDFANEAFATAPYTIPLPKTDKLMDPPCNCLLAEFDGSLAAFVYAFRDYRDEKKPFDFEIWVWKEEESSWARVVSEIIIDQLPAAAVQKPLCLLNSDKFYFQDSKGQLLLLDCAKRELKSLGLSADALMASVLPYVESVEPIRA